MAETYENLEAATLRQRRTSKWTHFEQDVIPAWIAEMDFPTAPVIREALIDAIERSETGYPPAGDAMRLPQACAAWLKRSFGWHVEPEQIGLLPDVLKGIELGVQIFSRSESPVIIPTPSYPPFFAVVQSTGRPIIEVPMLRDEDRYVFDLEGIGAAFAAGAGTLILCNPHNPLGRVFTRAELCAVAEIVERYGARVIADEVHAPLIYPGAQHIPYATVSDAAAHHAITLTSASKGWNVAGLKCAQCILVNDRDLAIARSIPFLRILWTYSASTLGILANTVAYEEGGPWLEETVSYLDGNRRHLADLLGRLLPDVGYIIPEGTYLAWLDCRLLGLENPAEFFLEQARVGLNDGAAFGPPGVGYVRFNFATSRPILTEIVERMAVAVERQRSAA